MRLPVWIVVATACLAPLPVAAETVTVLGQVVLGESKLDGEKIGEFSALVRDPVGAGVLGISDRGYMARLEIGMTDGRLTRVTPASVHVLTGSDGGAMRDQEFNPEGAALLGDGTVAVVSESGPRLSVFDLQGNWLRDEALPAPLQDASLQASEKDGIEAVAWTAANGFIAMVEEPQSGQPRDLHALHSTLSGSVDFSTGQEDSISIKAIETLGNRMVILERTRDDVTEAMQPWLRLIDIDTCLGQALCETQQLPIALNGLSDADFEGLVALDDTTFLMVSDDKIEGDLRSVFVLLRIEQ